MLFNLTGIDKDFFLFSDLGKFKLYWGSDFVGIFLYFFLSEGLFKKSLGKATMGLVVKRYDGENIDLKTSAVRNFARLLSTLPLCAGYMYAFFNNEGKTLHDILSKTKVVKNNDKFSHE